MLAQQENPFSFIAVALVDNFCLTEEQTRRKHIITLMKSVAGIIKPFKVVNELVCALQKQPFFKAIENNYKVLNQICQKMALRHFKKHEKIYQQGQFADYFYFVLSGIVHLTVPQQIEGIAIYEKGIQKDCDKKSVDTFLERSNPFLKLLTTPELQEADTPQKILQTIEPGQGFGQMIQADNLRQSSAIAAEDCRVLCLKRPTYQILLQAQLKTVGYERHAFMRQIPLFKSLSSYALSRICLLMKEQHLSYSQTLFNSNQEIQKLFVVLSGQFKLSKKIYRGSMSQIQDNKIDSKKMNVKNAQYLIVQKGQVLGDYQILNQQKHYQQLCTCEQQQGTVLSIDKGQFLKIIMEDEKDFASAKKVVMNKNLWKKRFATSFVQRRSRNSFMNVYLHDPKRSYASVCKKRQQSMNKIKSEINDDFFYNNMNKTILQSANKQRFSISRRGRCATENNQSKNLFSIRNKPKQKVPHAIQDIVQLVRLKSNFQKRFRKQKRINNLFKFNQQNAPLYIKSRFNKVK